VRPRPGEPEQRGERRVTLRRPGTTAYLKVAYHAPGARDPDFLPALVLDAVLTGAKGVNLWSSFREAQPNRSARLYRALVERGLVSAVAGALLPTEQPFLYTVSATATEGTPLASVESAFFEEIDRVVQDGITAPEIARAKAQLTARLVFEGDSVTDVAHQLGYFETIGAPGVYADVNARIAAVSVDDVARAARRLLPESNRTVGLFEPRPVTLRPAAGADREMSKEE
jgi:zinc protease